MQIKITGAADGEVPFVQVIDPSDGAIAREEAIEPGQVITVTCLTARTPADFEVVCEDQPKADGECAPDGEAEAPTPEAGEGEQANDGEQGEAEGAEQPADGEAAGQAQRAETSEPGDGPGEQAA